MSGFCNDIWDPMYDQEQWTAVDRYLTDKLVPPDDALDDALRASEAAGLPAISVAPNQGRMLELLARVQGARRILEIGTLGVTARSGWHGRCQPVASC